MEFHHCTNRSHDLRLGPRPPGPHFLLLPKLGEQCGHGLLCHTLLMHPTWPRSQPPLQAGMLPKCSCSQRLCVCSANQVPSPASAAIPLLPLLNSQRHLFYEFVCQGSQLFHPGVHDLLTTASVCKGAPRLEVPEGRGLLQ